MRARTVTLIAVALMALGFSTPIQAKECYGGFFVGMASAGNIPTKQQRKLLAYDHIEGTFDVEENSRPYGFYVGCEWQYGFALEGSHMRGLGAEIDTNAALVADTLLHDHLWVLAVPFQIKEQVKIETYGVSFLWNFPPKNMVRGYVRAGAIYAFGQLDAALIVDGEDLVDYHRERQGAFPYFGLGLAVRSQSGLQMRLELQQYPAQVRVLTFGVAHRF